MSIARSVIPCAAIFVVIALAGCQKQTVSAAPDPQKSLCDQAAASALAGKNRISDQQAMQQTGATLVRQIKPGDPVTMDFHRNVSLSKRIPIVAGSFAPPAANRTQQTRAGYRAAPPPGASQCFDKSANFRRHMTARRIDCNDWRFLTGIVLKHRDQPPLCNVGPHQKGAELDKPEPVERGIANGFGIAEPQTPLNSRARSSPAI